MSVLFAALENLGLKTPFRYAGTSSEYLGQVCMSRSSGEGQGHRSKRAMQAQLNAHFAGCLPSTGRQSWGYFYHYDGDYFLEIFYVVLCELWASLSLHVLSALPHKLT